MFKVPPSGGGLEFFSNEKSSDHVLWAKQSFKPGEDQLTDGKKPEETSVVDVDDATSDSIDGDNSKESMDGDLGPVDVFRKLVHRRVAALAQFGYQFMRPVRYNEDQSMVCWNIVEAFADDTSTHGVSHVLNTSGKHFITFNTQTVLFTLF